MLCFWVKMLFSCDKSFGTMPCFAPKIATLAATSCGKILLASRNRHDIYSEMPFLVPRVVILPDCAITCIMVNRMMLQRASGRKNLSLNRNTILIMLRIPKKLPYRSCTRGFIHGQSYPAPIKLPNAAEQAKAILNTPLGIGLNTSFASSGSGV
jgi:hypothetical protein